MAEQKNGRITSRPKAQRNLGSTVTGLRETGIEEEHDGLLYVPESYNPKKASPLLIMLYGKGVAANHGIDPLRAFSEKTGTILLSTEAQNGNWDLLVKGKFGADLNLIDEALSDLFALYQVDSEKVAIGGFGEGATYALSIAAANADLFTHTLAFAPTSSNIPHLETLPPAFVAAAANGELVNKMNELGVEVEVEDSEAASGKLSDELIRRGFKWFLGLDLAASTRPSARLS